MLTLAFRAGPAHLAIAVRSIVQVLPRAELRPPTLAPPAVRGLLPFRGTLTPVVDLCWLVAGRPANEVMSSRIILVQIGDGAAARFLGLLAEDVSELVELGTTTPGLRLAEHGWLGDHLAQAPGMPQLVEPGELLPDALTALFVADDSAHDG